MATTPSRLRQRIGVVLLYAVLGPPVGMFGLMLVIAGANAPENGQYAQILMAPMLVFSPFVLVAYIFGGVPALATGLVMAALDRIDRFWLQLMIVALIGAASSLIWQLVSASFSGWQNLLMLPLVGAFSAIVCTLLHRALSSRQDGKQNENR